MVALQTPWEMFVPVMGVGVECEASQQADLGTVGAFQPSVALGLCVYW